MTTASLLLEIQTAVDPVIANHGDGTISSLADDVLLAFLQMIDVYSLNMRTEAQIRGLVVNS